MGDLKSQINTSFKLSGLTVRLEANKYLVGLLTPFSQEERQGWIDRIIDIVTDSNLKSNVIDKEILSSAVRQCTNQEAGKNDVQILNTINAFDVPRLCYNPERKKYLPDSFSKRSEPLLLAPADCKSRIFLDRYSLLHQRTARHDLFSGQSLGGGGSRFQLKTVEYLLGTTNRLDDVIVLGMITQMSHGTYHLEDPSGVVKLNMTEAKFHTGLFTENCFVLAEGWYEDNEFHILALGFPPAESSSTTRAYFGNVNFFGGPGDTSLKNNQVLAEMEANNPDAMLCFLSDVWLDQVNVMDNLRKLFQGFNSAMPPAAFVFCGNFLSAVGESDYSRRLREHLRLLGEMILEFDHISSQSTFLFVPGPADPGSPNIFPRPPVPAHITQDLSKLVKNCKFLSNPARVQFCTQEIVIFREDIVTKMCRNSIHYPESGEVSHHFAKTITCQAHLTPLPLHMCPVYWDFDRSLSLYPLPDLVVTADKFEPFTADNIGCKVINPGTFAKHGFSFKTYIPGSKSVEDSQVPPD